MRARNVVGVIAGCDDRWQQRLLTAPSGGKVVTILAIPAIDRRVINGGKLVVEIK